MGAWSEESVDLGVSDTFERNPDFEKFKLKMSQLTSNKNNSSKLSSFQPIQGVFSLGNTLGD
jgi:hypothetical protein